MGEAKRRRAATGLRPLVPAARLPPISKLVVPAGAGVPNREALARAFAVAEKVRAALRRRLVAASADGNVDAVLDAIDAIGAETVGAFEAELRRCCETDATARAQMAAVQCRRGCAYCCHVDVVVTPCEAIRIARAVARGEVPAPAASAVAAAGPWGRESARRACPLLVDSACSAYAIRPFACRALFSLDARLCEAGYADAAPAEAGTPGLAWPRLLSMGYLTGELAALRDLGLKAHLVELRAALRLLLKETHAVTRWLNGAVILPEPRQ